MSDNGNGNPRPTPKPAPAPASSLPPVLIHESAEQILKEWRRAKRNGMDEDRFCAEWNRAHPEMLMLGNMDRPVPIYTRLLSELPAMVKKLRGEG